MAGFCSFQLFAIRKRIAHLFAQRIVAVAGGIVGDGMELVQVDFSVGEDTLLSADVDDSAQQQTGLFVVAVKFTPQLVYIRFVGTHNEYDRIDVKTI